MMLQFSSDTSGSPSFAPGTSDSVSGEVKKLRILIVEDELLVAMELESTLQELGHEICAIEASGREALAAFERESPELVFLDVNLRGSMDGVEVARLIRTARKIPIVFVTAYSDVANVGRMGAAAPGAPVITKPATPTQLAAAIQASLRLAS